MNKTHLPAQAGTTNTKILTKAISKALDNGFDWGVGFKVDHWKAVSPEESDFDYIFIWVRPVVGVARHFSLPDITSRHSFWKALVGEKLTEICPICERSDTNIGSLKGGLIFCKCNEIKVIRPAHLYHITQYHLLPTQEEQIKYLEGLL